MKHTVKIANEILFYLAVILLVIACGILTKYLCTELNTTTRCKKLTQLADFAKQAVIYAEKDGLINKLTAQQQFTDALNRFQKLLKQYGITDLDIDIAKQLIEQAYFENKSALESVYKKTVTIDK